MTTHRRSAEEIISSFEQLFPSKITNARVERRTSGSKKTAFTHLWMRLDTDIFKDAVKHIFTFDSSAHFAVTSGYELGDFIELVYHFSIYHGKRAEELSINFTVAVPKSYPVIETITDLFPGALISEQEKQEMLGVTIEGIPQDTRVFLSDDFPKEVYPWRRDSTGPAKLIRNLHEEKP